MSDNSLFFGNVEVPGQVFIFCNGIETSKEGAVGNAKIISDSFEGRKVEVFYNPTSLVNYFDNGEEESLRRSQLAQDLALKIQHPYGDSIGQKKYKIKMFLFVYLCMAMEPLLRGRL